MRVLVSMICMAAALLLIAASMLMNWIFWTGQGADASMARGMGAVSIGIDGFKVSLPLVIAWAWDQRIRAGYVIGTFFFCGCLIFSFGSALGFANSSRGAVSAGREAVSLRYAAAEKELKDVDGRVAALGALRPKAVVEEAIAKVKQDRRWSSSNECKAATVETSLAFCRSLGDLRIELASSVESERLRQRSSSLKTEIDHLLDAGARRETDSQAAILARLTGLRLDRVQTSIVVLFALLVELGAAFGLFLATLPLRGRLWFAAVARPARPAFEILPPAKLRAKSEQRPTRFVRAADGQLMIE